jgi:hypothetical protein
LFCPKCDVEYVEGCIRCRDCNVLLVRERPKRLGKHIFFFLCGVVCLFGIMPIAILTWQLLPPGYYPVIVAGLPALPLLWLSSVCFRRSGLKLEEFARRDPASFKLALYIVFGALALGFLLVLDELGLL